MMARMSNNTMPSKPHEEAIRAAIAGTMPADPPKPKKVAVANLLRKIAAEYDGTAPGKSKASKKVKVSAGDAVAGADEDELKEQVTSHD
jgi:hypothetical protein